MEMEIEKFRIKNSANLIQKPKYYEEKNKKLRRKHLATLNLSKKKAKQRNAVLAELNKLYWDN